MITKKDNEIIRTIEAFGGITITQTSKIFYKENKYSYDTARIRLSKLNKMGVLKCYFCNAINEKVYYLEQKPSGHSILINNVYAELCLNGAEIIKYEKEISFLTEYRHDAFVIYKYHDKFKAAIIECDLTHFTSQKKLDDVFNSNILQEKYQGFPLVIVLCNSQRDLRSNEYTIVLLDTPCSNFKVKVLDI